MRTKHPSYTYLYDDIRKPGKKHVIKKNIQTPLLGVKTSYFKILYRVTYISLILFFTSYSQTRDTNTTVY